MKKLICFANFRTARLEHIAAGRTALRPSRRLGLPVCLEAEGHCLQSARHLS
jgi:hypothetical protein